MTKVEIKKLCKTHNVNSVSLWFTDVLGMLKSVSVSIKEIDDVIENGKFFDGSSIEGFARIEESDLLLQPDLDTFLVLPFEIGDYKIGRLICDVYKPNNTSFTNCPRGVLKRTLQKLSRPGYKMYCGPELEYFYLKENEDQHDLIDRGKYFDMLGIDEGTVLREKTLSTLESIGIKCECTHHEVAPSSHEIGLKYAEALKMADQVMTYRFIVKAVAQQAGFHATFMPKPITGINGSGMHVHQSLFKGAKNIFYDKQDEYGLSAIAKFYTAGLLKYSREITLTTNQWVNSYKRLVPGYEAPTYIAWGRANRSALVRIPATRPGKAKATRVEYRAPDPACNPYLAFASMLGAGLQGIKEKLVLDKPAEDDIYHLSKEELDGRKIGVLPDNLIEAVQEAEESKFLQDLLGEGLHTKLLENKHQEWDEYRIQVSDYEKKRYLPIL
ncbi:glutamine synthetase family protein [Patescibacteria group bacterium]|nr:glutamine synthetase family protein [Patescibacteria group bacterium]